MTHMTDAERIRSMHGDTRFGIDGDADTRRCHMVALVAEVCVMIATRDYREDSGVASRLGRALREVVRLAPNANSLSAGFAGYDGETFRMLASMMAHPTTRPPQQLAILAELAHRRGVPWHVVIDWAYAGRNDSEVAPPRAIKVGDLVQAYLSADPRDHRSIVGGVAEVDGDHVRVTYVIDESPDGTGPAVERTLSCAPEQLIRIEEAHP